MAWVDPQCNCAVEMAHTISLQQVAQVDAPSTAQIRENWAFRDTSFLFYSTHYLDFDR
jgi:hypothetical protein